MLSLLPSFFFALLCYSFVFGYVDILYHCWGCWSFSNDVLIAQHRLRFSRNFYIDLMVWNDWASVLSQSSAIDQYLLIERRLMRWVLSKFCLLFLSRHIFLCVCRDKGEAIKIATSTKYVRVFAYFRLDIERLPLFCIAIDAFRLFLFTNLTWLVLMLLSMPITAVLWVSFNFNAPIQLRIFYAILKPFTFLRFKGFSAVHTLIWMYIFTVAYSFWMYSFSSNRIIFNRIVFDFNEWTCNIYKAYYMVAKRGPMCKIPD